MYHLAQGRYLLACLRFISKRTLHFAYKLTTHAMIFTLSLSSLWIRMECLWRATHPPPHLCTSRPTSSAYCSRPLLRRPHLKRRTEERILYSKEIARSLRWCKNDERNRKAFDYASFVGSIWCLHHVWLRATSAPICIVQIILYCILIMLLPIQYFCPRFCLIKWLRKEIAKYEMTFILTHILAMLFCCHVFFLHLKIHFSLCIKRKRERQIFRNSMRYKFRKELSSFYLPTARLL